jgi:hypothetical protein
VPNPCSKADQRTTETAKQLAAEGFTAVDYDTAIAAWSCGERSNWTHTGRATNDDVPVGGPPSERLSLVALGSSVGSPGLRGSHSAEDGSRERLASSRPAHRLDDDVDELAGFCKGAALTCGTGANPRQPVDPDLDALDIAKPLKGVVHVDDQIAHHFDPGPGTS